MSHLRRKAGKAWEAIEDQCDNCCNGCPLEHASDCGEIKLQLWLLDNGFPARRPLIHTVAGLAKQIIKGSSLSCLTQRIAQHVEAATCPGCGKHTLFRERRMICTGCNGIYPADKWAAGEPCDCGRVDARYFGIHSANRLGQLEFQQCQTPGCRWGGDYRRLTVQELADAAQVLAGEQWIAARTCPACGEVSGENQLNGVYLPIESCACGWKKPKGERKWLSLNRD